PIEIAHRLLRERSEFLQILKLEPESAHRILETITASYVRFCLACLKAGADGIFFATKWANSEWLSWNEYEEFGKQYEWQILETLNERNALIILHVCGANTYLERMLDYPVDIFSYDFFAKGSLPPQTVIEESGKFAMGGIDPELMISNPNQAASRCRQFL